MRAAPKSPAERIVVALDLPDLDSVQRMVDATAETIRTYKVGGRLFTAEGPEAVARVQAAGAQVFLDLKYHDIPNTVAESVAAARDLGVAWLTVHASGGPAMLEAAARAAGDQLVVLAVTVLTSLDEQDIRSVGVVGDIPSLVARRASLAVQAGCQGLVCSPQEAGMLREALGPKPLLITPGIRPAGAATGDQKRSATPCAAVASGADYLVIGRPITQSSDPAAAVAAILAELEAAPP